MSEVEVKVSKKTYCALRSFLESSRKPIYVWNNPINMPDGTKYYIKPNKWVLEIYPRFTGSKWVTHVAINFPDFILTPNYVDVEGRRFDRNQQVIITCDKIHNPLPISVRAIAEKVGA
jgi:hypothetical protein